MNIKNLFVLLFCFSSTVLFAQTNHADSTTTEKKSHIVRAELGYSQIARTGSFMSTTPFQVIRLGGNVEFPLKYNVGIETGLNYNFAFGNKTQYAGNKIYEDYYAIDTINYSYQNHSLNIPLHITYNLPIFWGLKLFAYAGPTFNLGLAEPTTVDATKNMYANSGKYDLYTDKLTYIKDSQTQKQVQLSRFNMQLGLGGGIQWKQYRVRSGYDWGLTNFSRTQDTNQYNKGWSVSFEYQF